MIPDDLKFERFVWANSWQTAARDYCELPSDSSYASKSEAIDAVNSGAIEIQSCDQLYHISLSGKGVLISIIHPLVRRSVTKIVSSH